MVAKSLTKTYVNHLMSIMSVTVQKWVRVHVFIKDPLFFQVPISF